MCTREFHRPSSRLSQRWTEPGVLKRRLGVLSRWRASTYPVQVGTAPAQTFADDEHFPLKADAETRCAQSLRAISLGVVAAEQLPTVPQKKREESWPGGHGGRLYQF